MNDMPKSPSTVSSGLRKSLAEQHGLQATHASLQKLEKAVSETNGSTQPLLSLLQSRSHHLSQASNSRAHLSALQALSARTQKLQRMENAIWTGQGTDPDVIEKVIDMGIGQSQVTGLLGRSRINEQLNRKAGHLRTLLSSQLTEAFDRACSVSPSSPARLSIKKEISLSIPPGKNPLSVSPASPPNIPLHALLQALHSLGLLQALLLRLRSQITQTVVLPLLRVGSQLEVRVVAETPVLDITLESVATSDGDTRRVCDGLDTVLRTLNECVSTSTTPDLPPVRSFLLSLRNEALGTLLSTHLIPKMPSAVGDLPDWLADVRVCQQLESKLLKSSSDAKGDIENFLDDQAGKRWAQERRWETVERVRRLIGGKGGWQGWREVRVDRTIRKRQQHLVDDGPALLAENGTGVQTSSLASSFASNGAAKLGNEEEAMEEDGWDFDEHAWEATPENSTPAPEPKAVHDKDTSTDSAESGWSFDDVGAGPAEAEPVVVLAKPARVARKIGKAKGKGKETESEASDAPVGTLGNQSPSGWKQDQELDTSWADMDAVPSPIQSATGTSKTTATPTRQPDPTPTVETCAVSVACAALVDIIEDALKVSAEVAVVSNFSDLSPVLKQAATDAIDLYRALLPVAHSREVESVPSLAIQFANDCEELAGKVRDLAGRYDWDAGGAEGRLMELSSRVCEAQVATQKESLREALQQADGFVDVAYDETFDRCSKAVDQARDELQMLHRQWKPVMTETSCLESSGVLVNFLVSQITEDILMLPDITAKESERLDVICKSLHSLEDLFTSHHGSRIVEYVPTWLRFCYISELLSGSLVDITYLLETGALVDYTDSELVHLIAALFSDSPKRLEVIAKITNRST